MKIKNLKISLLFICAILCLCGCGKKENSSISGAFGTGETVSESKVEESSESDEAKFAIKDDVTLSTEEIDSDINLSSLQQAKINEIEQNLKLQNKEITEDEVTELLNIDEFVNISDSEKLLLATKIIDRISDLSTSETLSSELVYKHATSYETNEIVIDEEAPERFYSDEELAIMHSEAESLYQQQQISETFEFDD